MIKLPRLAEEFVIFYVEGGRKKQKRIIAI